MSLSIQVDEDPDVENGVEAHGLWGDKAFTLRARLSEVDGVHEIAGVLYYDMLFGITTFRGVLQQDGRSILGTMEEDRTWSFVGSSKTHQQASRFTWMRVQAHYMRIRPLPPYVAASDPSHSPDIGISKARAMWKYAILAVRSYKSSFPWDFFKARRDARIQCMEYWTKNNGDNLNQHMQIDFRAFTPADCHLWKEIWEHRKRMSPQHG